MWSSRKWKFATLANRLPPDIDVEAKYDVHLRFAVEPTDTAWKGH
jgi:hypothetical protein